MSRQVDHSEEEVVDVVDSVTEAVAEEAQEVDVVLLEAVVVTAVVVAEVVLAVVPRVGAFQVQSFNLFTHTLRASFRRRRWRPQGHHRATQTRWCLCRQRKGTSPRHTKSRSR